MDYSVEDGLDELIRGLSVDEIRLGLGRAAEALLRLDSPERSYRVVQVVGTNGKGSVCSYLDSIFRASGFRVGLYTSPHLVSPRERIRVDGAMVGAKEIEGVLRRVHELCFDLELTYFELMTVCCALLFAERGVEVAVFEAGMGGRYDATTALSRLDLLVFTNVGLDHVQYLGPTRHHIFVEKAHAHRGGAPAVLGLPREDLDAFPPFFESRGVRVSLLADAVVRPAHLSLQGNVFDLWLPGRGWLLDLETRLAGLSQLDNASLAVLASLTLEPGLEELSLREGLLRARWPGRLQVLRSRPLLLVDGVHNAHGAEALAATLRELGLSFEVILFSAMSDKDHRRMLSLLSPFAELLVLCPTPGSARSLTLADWEEVARRGRSQGFIRSREVAAMEAEGALELASIRSALVCGSLYFLGWFLRRIGWSPD